ncbi:MAG: hypothetical protein JNM43_14565 [Planctomycetaceae bacterium]|nr:hypothetical protein [Planctomycetaceae bacterium]
MRFCLHNLTAVSGRCSASIRRLWVCLAVLLGSLMTGLPSVQAETCGHYLYRNGKPVAQHHGQMVAPEELSKDGLAVPQETKNPFAPCNGPHCRSNSNPLLPAPVPTSMTQSTDPAVLLEALLSLMSDGDMTSLPASERGAHYQAMSIFRPPCLV